MELWEAVKLLNEGKKVRKQTWRKDEYIYLDNYVIKDEKGRAINTTGILFGAPVSSWEEVRGWVTEGIEDTKTVTSRICSHCCHKNYAPPAEAKYYIYCSYCGATIY